MPRTVPCRWNILYANRIPILEILTTLTVLIEIFKNLNAYNEYRRENKGRVV